jgi:hypothetical protein
LGNPNQSSRIQRAESNPVLLPFNLLVSFVFFLVLVNHHHHRQDHLARDNVARGKQSRPGKSNPRKKKGKIWKALGILSSFLLFNYLILFSFFKWTVILAESWGSVPLLSKGRLFKQKWYR